MSNRSVLKPVLWSFSILLILCGIGAIGYLAITTLPAFYQAPPVQNRISWDGIPQPLVVRNEWQTWTTTKDVNDAIWTNNLVWLATDGGVSIEDLTTGEKVKFLPEHGVPSVNISTIESDRNGNIWIGTNDSGIGRYDGGAWDTFTMEDGLPSDMVRDIYAAPDGVIWAATSAGAARFDGDDWSPVRFSFLDVTRIDATSIAGVGQSIWIGSRQGVYHFNGEQWEYFGLNEGVINADIAALTITPDRKVWVATPSGIGRFDGISWDRFTVLDGLPDLPALDIMAAPDNSIWIYFGEDDASGSGEPAQTIRFDGVAVTQIAAQSLNGLVSQNGRLWLATENGLIDGSNPLENKLLGADDFPHLELNELVETDDGVAVVGSAGISYFSEQNATGTWRTTEIFGLSAIKQTEDGRVALAGEYPADGVRLLSSDGATELLECRNAGIQAGNLYAITEDLDGGIWILGTESVGLYSNGQWRYFNDGLPVDFTPRKIVADSNGTLWLGLSEGLFRFNHDSLSWDLYDSRTVQRMTAGLNGSLWLVAENQLLHWVDGEFVRFILPEIEDVSRGFVANEFGLWVSSANGVGRLGLDGNWQIYTIADGLSTDDVTTLTLDQAGNVWAGYADSRFGASKFVDGRWEIVHNILDPNEPNNGHQAINAPRRDEVVSIAVINDEKIWMGSYFGEIGRIAADELLYEPDDWRLYFENMTAIHPASDGSLWFIGWGGRIARLYPENVTGDSERWLIYERTLASAKVQDVVVQNNIAWLGTQDGVARLENGECRMVAHREQLNVVRGEINPADDSIWWATSNNGGLRLDVETEKLDWPVLQLRGRKFSDMIVAPDDSMWFVSNQVLFRLDGTDWQTQQLGQIGNVSATAIGADLRPWVATDRGLASLRKGEWEMLNTRDGLSTNNLQEILVESNGTVWLLGKSSVSRR